MNNLKNCFQRRVVIGCAVLCTGAAFLAGCGARSATRDSTPASRIVDREPAGVPASEIAQAGDVASDVIMEGFEVMVNFLGAPNLNTRQRVRPDGKITMPLVGEVTAVGLTPLQLEDRLRTLYAPELISTEMTVTLVSAAFPVYITGAVGQNGEILCDRPTTAFELVMRAAVDLERANLTRVVVIRRENNQPKRFVLNLELVLDGRDSGLFFLQPGDTIYVPRKFI